MGEKTPYLERNADGVLQVSAASSWSRESYQDPGEAILVWYAGERRFGCTHRSFSHYQSHPCGIKPKYDPDHNGNPTKCGHHSKAALDRKEAKRKAKDAEMHAKWDHRRAMQEYNAERDEIIRKIADGHNDPRRLCQDWLDRKPQNP